jgi:hypothetical protein
MQALTINSGDATLCGVSNTAKDWVWAKGSHPVIETWRSYISDLWGYYAKDGASPVSNGSYKFSTTLARWC